MSTTLVHRVPELDGLRGLAVGAVLLWHFTGALLSPSLGWWTIPVYHVSILGRTGVDLFFVLSGFLITSIILGRRQSPAKFVRHFYLRRAFRICPPYILLVVIFWAVVSTGTSNPAFSAATPVWRHLTFTQNLWMVENGSWGPGAISVTWSVSIEEQFYLVFPLLVLVASSRALPSLLVAIAACSIAFRAYQWFGVSSNFGMYVHTLSRLDGLAAGALLAWAWSDPSVSSTLLQHRARIIAWTKRLGYLFPILAISIAWNLPLTMAAWGHTYLTLFYTMVLASVLCSLGQPSCIWLRRPTLIWLGAVSYTVYLFHPLVLSLVFMLVGRPEQVATQLDALLALVALALTFAYSALSLLLLERPLLSWGRRWSY
jgi:peptidoglycan/LPS O-acetylase OafA/YrhL